MSHEEVLELLASQMTGLNPSVVLAHDSDPVAVFGVFGSALVFLLIVVGAVIWDRRRHGRRRDTDEAG